MKRLVLIVQAAQAATGELEASVGMEELVEKAAQGHAACGGSRSSRRFRRVPETVAERGQMGPKGPDGEDGKVRCVHCARGLLQSSAKGRSEENKMKRIDVKVDAAFLSNDQSGIAVSLLFFFQHRRIRIL